jgi:hypothetical protein
MKKKAIKRLWCLLLAISMFLAISIPAAASEEVAPENLTESNRLTGTISVRASISKVSAGKVKCSGKVILRDGYTASVTMTLQRMSGGSWTPVDYWTQSGSGTISFSHTKNVSTGYSYRCVVTAVVYDSNGNYIESATAYSSSLSV